MQKTLAIIKPDAIALNISGFIINLIELNKFNIIKLKKMQFKREMAEKFYAIHSQKPFFSELVDYMISGPVITMVLEKEDAIASWRQLMGATDPKKADVGTIRYMFGKSIGSNVVHGSDSIENSKIEIDLLFSE